VARTKKGIDGHHRSTVEKEGDQNRKKIVEEQKREALNPHWGVLVRNQVGERMIGRESQQTEFSGWANSERAEIEGKLAVRAMFNIEHNLS